jgi:hypothetical protein
MTDDLIHGNAQVEEVADWRVYLATRAVTMNQLWFLDDRVHITPLGLVDTLAGVIRITQSHLNANRGRVHPIIAFKVLRFAAHMQAEGREPRVLPMRVNFRRRSHPFAFFFALQLSRACESGLDVAERYLDLVREWNLLEKTGLPDDVTVHDAGEILTERLSGYHLTFAV